MTKCVHCGSTKFGADCPKSLNHLHQHNTDERHCIYCGSSSYGNGCLKTPTKKHVHGHGGGKCIHCGAQVGGSSMGCPHSPIQKHES